MINFFLITCSKNRYIYQRAELCPLLPNILAEPAGKSLVGVGNTDMEKLGQMDIDKYYLHSSVTNELEICIIYIPIEIHTIVLNWTCTMYMLPLRYELTLVQFQSSECSFANEDPIRIH
jgi:hypothetical protein